MYEWWTAFIVSQLTQKDLQQQAMPHQHLQHYAKCRLQRKQTELEHQHCQLVTKMVTTVP